MQPSKEEIGPKKTRDSSPTEVCAPVSARNCPGTVALTSPKIPESKDIDFQSLKKALSHERFTSYSKSAEEPDELVFKRYQWNAEVSECFYAVLTVLEVILRNRMDIAIASNFKNPEWLKTIPAWLDDDRKEDVQGAQDYLNERKREVTQARLVQEMSFGFWTSLFNSRYESLFHATAARVFPHMPRAIRTRSNVSRRFESIRRLRNNPYDMSRDKAMRGEVTKSQAVAFDALGVMTNLACAPGPTSSKQTIMQKPHGLSGKPGNNQTKKGRNLRYVIQARDFLKKNKP